MSEQDRRPTSHRELRRRHERQMVVMVLLTLVVVGGGLIGIVFGWAALLGSLPFLLAGAGAIGGLYLFFVALERLRG